MATRALSLLIPVVILVLLCAGFAVAYLLWDVQGSWSYALDLRTRARTAGASGELRMSLRG